MICFNHLIYISIDIIISSIINFFCSLHFRIQLCSKFLSFKLILSSVCPKISLILFSILVSMSSIISTLFCCILLTTFSPSYLFLLDFGFLKLINNVLTFLNISSDNNGGKINWCIDPEDFQDFTDRMQFEIGKYALSFFVVNSF